MNTRSVLLPSARHARIAAALLLLAGAGPAIAQENPGSGAGAEKRTGAVRFDTRPLRLDAIGMTLRVPEGSSWESTRVGASATTRVLPTDQTWLMNIQTPRTSDEKLTVRDVLDDLIRDVLSSAGEIKDTDGNVIGVPGRVIDRVESLTINGQEAARFYAELAPTPGEPPRVSGYTIFRPAPGRFVTFELLTTRSEFERVRGDYETVVATASFEDPEVLSATRQSVVNMGAALLARMTPDELEAVVRATPERWDRLYTPGPTGAAGDAREIAYRRIRARVATRGELEERPAGRRTAAEEQTGFLVNIDSRYVQDAGTPDERIGDTQAAFWMSPDRQQEAWRIRQTVRAGGKPATFVETGVRNGSSVTVTTHGDGVEDRTIKPLIEGEGYLSRAEFFLLPQILVRSRTPADFGFYTYQSESSSIRLRRDTLSQPAERPGLWVLTTRQNDDVEPQVSHYTEDGRFLKTTLPDGSVWEPVEFARLVQLWRRQGLPME